MTEQQIQAQIIKYLKSEGYFCIKVMACTVSGTPDICAIGNGKTIWVEVKKPGGRLSRIQEHVIAQIRALNHKVYVSDSLKDLKEQLNAQ